MHTIKNILHHGSQTCKTTLCPPELAHTGESFLSTQYTLRCCNRDYRIETGSYEDSKSPPEFDCVKTPGKVGSFVTFDNFIGHCVDGQTRVFQPVHHESFDSFYSYVTESMRKSVLRSHAWDMDSVIKLTIKDVLADSKNKYSEHLKQCLRIQLKDPYSPISVYTPQAYSESLGKRGKDSCLFGLPSISTIVTGPLGGFHNNVSVEMGFEEKNGVKDIKRRIYDRNLLGFICAGYTSHSSDAGKARRISSYTRIRVSSSKPLWPLEHMQDTICVSGDWVIYCMGSTLCIDYDTVKSIVSLLNDGLVKYHQTQFNYPDISYCRAPPTYVVYESEKILYISISPGVILRSSTGNTMIDSSMMKQQKDSSLTKPITLDMAGDKSIEYFFNAFYLVAPLTKLNRQPRPLFACGQTTQGVFFPWSPATARVSPSHASSPLVATEFIRNMEDDHKTNPAAIWDIFPGEDMTVCFMNLPENYDDSMIVSSKFADMGGFSTTSMCTYRISQKDPEPIVGEKLCGKKYKWWKMPCPSSCECMPKSKKSKYIQAGRIVTSIVEQVIRTEDGGRSIKVLSFGQLMTGDKISMTAGQKGIAHLLEPADLPVIVMKNGGTFQADLYMALGSIVSRQTNGIIIESGIALNAAADGKKVTVGFADDGDTEECKYILDGITGEVMTCQMTDGSIHVMKASIGIIRVLNQTQMTRERHHLTHNTEGKRSLGTAPGRASGGGVAAAEMDFHAMVSSGMYGAAQELFDRGNCVRVPFCMACNRIAITRDCEDHHLHEVIKLRMSFDVAVLDMMSTSINSSSNIYHVEHV